MAPVQSLRAPSWWDDADGRWFQTKSAYEQLSRLYNPIARANQGVRLKGLRPGYWAEFVNADASRQRIL